MLPLHPSYASTETTPVGRSALWAAWGDALGFPVEMAREPRDLQRRFGADEVGEPPEWTRRIGGRFGPDIRLPAGTYSDDTQLRLAVGRCLRANGRFDAEAFSKVELPIFLSYELGAGRGTRQAAHALMRRAVRWSSNFFAQSDVRYVDGGGNGAAMRIQPHVWAARDHRAEHYLPGLLRDAVCTHGHPRGILGAAWHALALGTALREREIPPPDRWAEMARTLARVISRMQSDEALSGRWLPTWEREAGESFSAVCEGTISECESIAEMAARVADGGDDLADRYAELAAQLGGLRRETRGSGTVSAALSLWLAWVARDDPVTALRIAANLRGSDTDTVASMAGGLLGAVAPEGPPGALQDRELILQEAGRLDRLRAGQPVTDFPHPDTLHWQPPPTLSDALGLDEHGQLAVAGLGQCGEIGTPVRGKGNEAAWQWVRLNYGQTLLIKRRLELGPLPSTALPRTRRSHRPDEGAAARPDAGSPRRQTASRNGGLPDRIDEALALVVDRSFDQVTIGQLVMHLAGLDNGEEKAGIFSALVARAARHERPREP